MNIKNELENNTITLEKVLESIWEMIYIGVKDSSKPFHTPTVATINLDQPNLRTVVLRRFDKKELSLTFHTDRRSHKIEEIIENPNAAWLFYDPIERVQLRITTKAVILTSGDFWEEQWKNSKLMSKRCYTILDNSGTIKEKPNSGIPEIFLEKGPTKEEIEKGKKNFAVIVSKIKHINWLFLKSSGNISAEFNFEENGITQNWIIP